jgi:hypothetical protein
VIAARRALLGLAAALAGCASAPAAPASPFGLEAAATGVVAGHAWTWDGATFAPAPGAAVRLDAREAIADDAGGFRFDGVAAGPWRLAAVAPGHRAAEAAGTALPGGTVLGVPVVLVADGADAALPADARAIVGTLADPHGDGVPGGTVHCVDDASGGGAGGNRRWVADAHGRFVGLLAGAAGRPGEARLMGYGAMPDGRRVEARAVRTIALGDDRIAVAALATEVEVPPGRTAGDIYPILNVATVTFGRFRVQ